MNNLNIKLAKTNIFDLLIVLLLIAVVLSNYIWLKLDQYPVEGHELMGIRPAVNFYLDLKSKKIPFKQLLLDRYGAGLFFSYPPLSFLILALFYFLFGLQGQMVVMVNSLYIAITLWSVYLIGKNIFNRPTGLLAAFILSSFPGFIAFSRIYWIEFGLMAYVTLDLYLLLKANFFENRKYSILLGISLALSFLHKYEFITFIIGPLLLVIYKSGMLQDIFKAKWSNKVTNFILTLALAIGLTSFWWGRSWKDIFGRISSVALIDENSMGNNLSSNYCHEFIYYYLNSMSVLISRLFLAFSFLSIIFIFIISTITKNKKNYYILSFLILSSVLPFIMLSLLKTKSASHILSILPIVALLISWSLYCIRNKLIKVALLTLIVAYCLDLHINSIYPVKGLNALNNFAMGLKLSPENYLLATYNSPRKERLEFSINEILQYIKTDYCGKNNAFALVVFERTEFTNCIFDYYRTLRNQQVRFFTCCNPATELSECDYIIVEVPEGKSVMQMLVKEKRFQERNNLKRIFKNGLTGLELLKIYEIPNGKTSVYIYKRKGDLLKS